MKKFGARNITEVWEYPGSEITAMIDGEITILRAEQIKQIFTPRGKHKFFMLLHKFRAENKTS